MVLVDVDPFHFERRARSAKTIVILALWWSALMLLYFGINANPWIILVLALISLPALYDIGANARADLTIDDREISWRTGRRGANLPRGQLQKVRLDTRLDLSLRMTLITHQGGKVRLPYECVPTASVIEAELKSQGIPYERHHFTLMS